MNGLNKLLTGVAAAAIVVFGAGCIITEFPPVLLHWYFDSDGDGDGHGDPEIVKRAEEQPERYVASRRDCDDTDAAINPDALEVFDSIDNDCDGVIDNVAYWYADIDEDGYGDPTVSLQQPTQPVGYVLDNTDCEVNNPDINPGAGETDGDSIDNNCDGIIDEYAIGYAGPAGGIVFYLDETGYHGLEVSPVDLDDETTIVEWGCHYTDVPGAEGTAIGTGAQNTADILAAGCTADDSNNPVAADLVSAYSLNGFNDWYLPSVDEVYELFLVKELVSSKLISFYWTSSESVEFKNIAHSISMISGEFYGYVSYKDNRFGDIRVRAIRSF